MFCIALSPTVGVAGNDAASGSVVERMQFAGLERSYLLHVPSSRQEAMPLLIVLHGGSGNARRMVELTRKRFDKLADGEGFLVAYPEGVEKHWNDGREIERYRAHREKIADTGFILAMIDHLAQRYNIDPRRVYAVGISNGGMMALRLACDASGRFAAVAAVAATMPADLQPQCNPANRLSVLLMHGTDDPLIPWKGGEIRIGRRHLGRILSAPDTAAFWVKQNRCRRAPISSELPDVEFDDDTRVRRETYRNCGHGTEVVLYAVDGGGHTWPGGRQYLPAFLIGNTSRDIDASDVIWEFFAGHRRQ